MVKSKMIRINDKLNICAFLHDSGSSRIRISSQRTDYCIEVTLEEMGALGHGLRDLYETMKLEAKEQTTPQESAFGYKF